MTSRFTGIQNGEYTKSYEEEFREVLTKFKTNADMSPIELQLLGQHRVVEELEAIAREHKLQLVDNAAILDADRRLMASVRYI